MDGVVRSNDRESEMVRGGDEDDEGEPVADWGRGRHRAFVEFTVLTKLGVCLDG